MQLYIQTHANALNITLNEREYDEKCNVYLIKTTHAIENENLE